MQPYKDKFRQIEGKEGMLRALIESVSEEAERGREQLPCAISSIW